MKIAILSSLYPPFSLGGAEQVAAQIAGALHRDGHTVDVISTCRRSALDGQPFRVDSWEGIRVWRIAPWNLYWRFDRETLNPPPWKRTAWHLIDLWNPSVIAPLRRVLEQIQPDVVNTHNIDGLSPSVWPVVCGSGAAVVHTLHDYHLICPRAILQQRDGTLCTQLCAGCRVYAAYHRQYQRHISCLISPSRATAAWHAASNWNRPAVFVVPNAVDTDFPLFDDRPADSPLQAVFMSRLAPEKGCAIMLRIAEHFRRRVDIHFHVAGEGPWREQFAQFRSPNFTFHGFVTGAAKTALLSAGDVFLQLSECPDVAPIGLREAKQFGMYIIATNLGGIPEMITDPAEGTLIAPADEDALVAAIEQAIATRRDLRSGRENRRTRASGYDVAAMAQEYLQAFRAASG